MIRFGIDATWIDLNYGNYSIEEEDSYDGEVETYTSQFHQAEVAMQVGPSITVTPLKRLNAHLYFRYAPSFSLLYLDESLMGNYATFFVTGGRITYGAIGLGIEARFGKANYKEFGAGDEADYDYDGDYDEEQSSIANKLKTSGMRVYLSFRF